MHSIFCVRGRFGSDTTICGASQSTPMYFMKRALRFDAFLPSKKGRFLFYIFSFSPREFFLDKLWLSLLLFHLSGVSNIEDPDAVEHEELLELDELTSEHCSPNIRLEVSSPSGFPQSRTPVLLSSSTDILFVLGLSSSHDACSLCLTLLLEISIKASWRIFFL